MKTGPEHRAAMELAIQETECYLCHGKMEQPRALIATMRYLLDSAQPEEAAKPEDDLTIAYMCGFAKGKQAQAALAAPVTAQQEPVAWQRPGQHVTRIPAVVRIWKEQGVDVEPLYTHPTKAQPVTDAEVRSVIVMYAEGNMTDIESNMRAALEAFLASRGQS
jgi:hypothetical protein